MAATCDYSPIRLLSPQLADQIAAGEVIERPASVLKELIENSLDAGATRIDVELLNGGMNLIRVTDDGVGIDREELPLAISRHATSKIVQLEDLLALQSLGFRGEALASICSVSQWEIISRRMGEAHGARLHQQQSLHAEAVAHAVGTSVCVQNLFYNIPARRKFLRSEATEYRYCEDVIARLALSRFDVGFFAQHNKRLTYRLPAAIDDMTRTRRVTQLLSDSFIQQAVMIEYAHQGLRLTGWLSMPGYSRQQNDLQYFYINGRGVRDRIINHAVRQAYQDSLPPGRHPAYVLYLEIDPRAVDINVHPTKYEVRFHENRRIHDFLSRCVRDSLHRPVASYPPSNPIGESAREIETGKLGSSDVAEPKSFYATLPGTVTNEGQLVFQRYFLRETPQGLLITDLQQVRVTALREQMSHHATIPVVSRPLLIPQVIEVSQGMMQRYEQFAVQLATLGFDISRAGPLSLMLRTIPSRVAVLQIETLVYELLMLPVATPDQDSATQIIDCVCAYVGRSAQPVDPSQLAGLLADTQYLTEQGGTESWLVTAEQFAQWCTRHHG